MSGWINVVGWVLVHFIWQGALIAIVAAVVLHACRKQSASLRYGIACGTLLMMLGAACTTASLACIAQPNSEKMRPKFVNTMRSSSDIALPIQIEARRSTVAHLYAKADIEALFPSFVFTWLIGVTVLLAREVDGLWRVRAIYQLASGTPYSSWQAAGKRIATKLGLVGLIRVVELPQTETPFVVGCLRPIVVLPIAAMSHMSASQVESILAHELAHIRRHDYVINVIQTIVETLLFYHPAVWWVSARIRDEREQSCDDIAVEICDDPLDYARALTELEAWRSRGWSIAQSAAGGSLLNRVRRILRADISDDSRMTPWIIVPIVLAVASGFVINILAQAQGQASPVLKFEVASIRLNTSGDNKMFANTYPGGRYTAINMPLMLLVRNAYRLQDYQLIGAPDWFSDRYDITAKAASEFPSTPRGEISALQLAIRSLLEERFKLVVRRETRELPTYVLVKARSDGKLGSELKPSTVNCEEIDAKRRLALPVEVPKPSDRVPCSIVVGFGEIAITDFPLSSFTRALSPIVQRLVVDRSGLSGNYALYVKWAPDEIPQGVPPPGATPAQIGPNGPSIFTALQEQLGLKLEATRGPVEVLVIDHAQRPVPD